MIMTRIKIALFTSCIGVVIVGCTTATGPLTQSYGRAQTIAKMSQTINPEASANVAPVAGFDGEAAKRAIERYYKGFEQAERQTQFVLPIATN